MLESQIVRAFQCTDCQKLKKVDEFPGHRTICYNCLRTYQIYHTYRDRKFMVTDTVEKVKEEYSHRFYGFDESEDEII